MLIKYTYIFFWNAERCSQSKHSCLNVDSNQDWITSVEYCIFDYLKSTWENSLLSATVFTLILASLDIFSKLIKQVIDNICSKDFNSFLFCKLCGLRSYSDIESQNCGEFFSLLFLVICQYFHSFHDIFLVNWSDRNAYNGDFGCFQEFKKSFQRTQSGGLNTDSLL